MLRLHCGLLALLALVLLAPPARATWGTDGNEICTVCPTFHFSGAPDGAGGLFVVWDDLAGLKALRLDGNGNVAPGWPAAGIAITTSSGGLGNVAPDGSGGFFACWEDSRNPATTLDIYAQHVLADGSIATGWPAGGAPASVNPVNEQSPQLVPDGQGGIFLVWDTVYDFILAQHLTAAGVPAPGWSPYGVNVCAQTAIFPSIMPDGTGGAVVAWRDFRRGGLCTNDTFDVYGERLTPTATVAPGWAVNGSLLAAGRWSAELHQDQAGGFYLLSASPTPDCSDGGYFVQRFTLDGAPLAGWPLGGLQVWSATAEMITGTPDGSGGLLLGWSGCVAGCNGYASRVAADATLAPGWPVGGVRLDDPSVANVYGVSLGGDGGGGSFLGWTVNDGGADAGYVQHLGPTGAIVPGWPLYGSRLASTCGQFGVQVVPDGLGGTFVVWDEGSGYCERYGLFAQHYAGGFATAVTVSLASEQVSEDAVRLVWSVAQPLGAGVQVERRSSSSGWQELGPPTSQGATELAYEDRAVSAGTRYGYRLSYSDGGQLAYSAETWVEVPALQLALQGLRPNPSAGEVNVAFTLQSGVQAMLELLDVSGRRVAAREVGGLGAGSHVLKLAEAGQVPAGVYWARLSQGARHLLARGVVIR